MNKVAQNLHASFKCKQVIDLIEYYTDVTTEWE
jgi:hypothetical protein